MKVPDAVNLDHIIRPQIPSGPARMALMAKQEEKKICVEMQQTRPSVWYNEIYMQGQLFNHANVIGEGCMQKGREKNTDATRPCDEAKG